MTHSTSLDLRDQQEQTGAAFDMAMLLEARQRTRRALGEIAGKILPGMTEQQAHTLARGVLRESQLLRGWHAPHIRFGTNTLKDFGAPSDPGVVLGTRDIFFIDIGPVWRGYEGDAGETFAVGDDPGMQAAARDVRAVFDATRALWRTERLTGQALYRRAAAEADRLGWQLNLNMSGHRLSDFPHAVKYAGALLDTGYMPASGLWVLEIQIRHPARPFGAFYEDLLLDSP